MIFAIIHERSLGSLFPAYTLLVLGLAASGHGSLFDVVGASSFLRCLQVGLKGVIHHSLLWRLDFM